jgi:hypothetical protein
VNRYGELARQHGASRLPEVYDGIRDPGWFFTVLGELLVVDIDQLADEIAGDDPPGEGYLAKVRRLTAARATAHVVVLSPCLDPPSGGRGQG